MSLGPEDNDGGQRAQREAWVARLAQLMGGEIEAQDEAAEVQAQRDRIIDLTARRDGLAEGVAAAVQAADEDQQGRIAALQLPVQPALDRGDAGAAEAALDALEQGVAAVLTEQAAARHALDRDYAPVDRQLTGLLRALADPTAVDARDEIQTQIAAQELRAALAATPDLREAVAALAQRVAQAYADQRVRLDARLNGGWVALLQASTEDEVAELREAAQAAANAENGALDAFVEAVDGLLAIAQQIEVLHAEADVARAGFLAQRTRSLAALQVDPDDFADPAMPGLMDRLTDVWGDLNDLADGEDWQQVAQDLPTLIALLDALDVKIAADVAAAGLHAQALLQQQQAAAAAAQLLAQQAANAAAAALVQRTLDIDNGILAGNAQFAAVSAIAKEVWRITRNAAPGAGAVENTSINGSHSLAAINTAIGEFNGIHLGAGPLVTCHVPGGGHVQDKRPKGRDEVQADFISVWPSGNRINVHVNLDRGEWHLV